MTKNHYTTESFRRLVDTMLKQNYGIDLRDVHATEDFLEQERRSGAQPGDVVRYYQRKLDLTPLRCARRLIG